MILDLHRRDLLFELFHAQLDILGRDRLLRLCSVVLVRDCSSCLLMIALVSEKVEGGEEP